MGKLTEFLMKAPAPPPQMGFCMPMMKRWVPGRLQPWIYVLTAFCFQFSGGMYLGALDGIRGTTNFMIEDVMFLLYATLAGMAVWFPMLFKMKFRFTNQQLLCTSAIVIGICNVITMYCHSMSILVIACFIAGIAKIQGTFECMSNIQQWITPKRDFAVFFPVLHIILLTAIEGSGWLAAWMAHHFTWQMMHVLTVGTMSFVLLTQILLCSPFCPMPKRCSLRGTDWQGALLICLTMLLYSYIFVYGDYYRWLASQHIRMAVALALVSTGLTIYRLFHNRYPYVELELLKCKNVVPILIVTTLAELAFGAEHTLEEILYSEVVGLEELTKESQYLWTLPGMFLGIALDLYWLKVQKWKIWKLIGIAFLSIFSYALLMYTTIGTDVNIEQYRLGIVLRGFGYGIMSPALMWALQESVSRLELFFMGLFLFNITHMYLGGAMGYGFYATIFSHFLNEDMMHYGRLLTLTNIDLSQFNFGAFMGGDYLHAMMLVAIKQVYGYVIWFSLLLAAIFLLCDIPAVRTNIRKVPLWPVLAIEYLSERRKSMS
ncbi:hypothetical protein [Prevotella sp. P3-122]|uniref:hypothetical protein n=1 Tax=Prevotella sp. P3-122 TaxID=2024223 RepID=UPI000B9635E3|nr:hypothetical protein [Prevotella sp. P3-122]OYP58788.1 hypothetical protein CIL02_13710 [Prevotella sp. P3-122]